MPERDGFACDLRHTNADDDGRTSAAAARIDTRDRYEQTMSRRIYRKQDTKSAEILYELEVIRLVDLVGVAAFDLAKERGFLIVGSDVNEPVVRRQGIRPLAVAAGPGRVAGLHGPVQEYRRPRGLGLRAHVSPLPVVGNREAEVARRDRGSVAGGGRPPPARRGRNAPHP